MIAGRFIGKEALAAVGNGRAGDEYYYSGDFRICMGSGVLMSGFSGAGSLEELKKNCPPRCCLACDFTIGVAGAGCFWPDRCLYCFRCRRVCWNVHVFI